MCRGHIDTAAGGAFLSLTIDKATALITKMVMNSSWGEGRKTQKGMHTVKQTDMLATKIDLLMKRLDDPAQEKEAITSTINALRVSSTETLATREMTALKPENNNRFRPET